MTAIATSYELLLKVRKGAVDIVDVPEFGFAAVTGTGEPGGAEFTEAVQALYSVSYGAHFRLKKLTGTAPRVMPLEGLWWVDDPAQQDIVAAVARGEVTMAGSDRGSWRWQALIMQPDPVDAELIAATAEAAGKKDLPGLARLEYIRWAEGRCAQLLHIGPYAAEAPSIAALHEAIAEGATAPAAATTRSTSATRAAARRRSCGRSSGIPSSRREAWHDPGHRRDRHRGTSGRGLRLRRRPAERAGLQPAHGAIGTPGGCCVRTRRDRVWGWPASPAGPERRHRRRTPARCLPGWSATGSPRPSGVAAAAAAGR